MIKPFFTDKGNYGSQIKPVLQDDDLIAKELNEFFKNAVSALNIKSSFITNRTSGNITDSIDKTVDKCKFHQSILLVQQHLKNHNIFSIKTVELGDIIKEVNNTNPKKATTKNSIPHKILKKFQQVFYINYLTIQYKRLSFLKI